jgi:uncharacterized protein with GYD domain
MPTYVVLLDWTEQGVKAAKDTVDRYRGAQEQFSELGVSFRDTYWTLGAHDIVGILDAPDDETLAAVLLRLAGQGNVRTTTMRAFSADEMSKIADRLG